MLPLLATLPSPLYVVLPLRVKVSPLFVVVVALRFTVFVSGS